MSSHQAKWIVIGGFGLLDAIWAAYLGIHVTAWSALTAPAVLLPIALIYTYLRPVERIAHLAMTFAQVQALAVVIAFLSYLVVTARFPLIDAQLAAIDVALGFDWLSNFVWITQRPYFERALTFAYYSGMAQPALLLLFFSVVNRPDRSDEMVWISIFNALLAIGVSMVLPAIGAWSWYGVANQVDAYHLSHFTALRDGELKSLDIATMKGLITFPSFHAAIAVIFVYVTRGIRYLFPFSLALNALMLISTPFVGGHHFIDVPAGMAVAGAIIMAHRLLHKRQARWPRDAGNAATVGV